MCTTAEIIFSKETCVPEHLIGFAKLETFL